jgi:hypothetical protein
MNKPKLKIGLFIEDYYVENWFYALVEKIFNSNSLEICLVIKNNSKKPINSSKLSDKIWTFICHLYFKLYANIEKKITGRNSIVFQAKNLKEFLKIEEIIILNNRKKTPHFFNEEQIKKIKSKKLDVILCQESNNFLIELSKFSKNGIWYYKHGNYNVETNKLSGVWETLKKDFETKVSLNVFKDNNEIKIYKTAFNTDHLFIWRNRHNVFWKSKSLIERKLNELHEFGSDTFFQKAESQNKIQENNQKLYKTPNNFETIKYISKLYYLAFIKVIKRQFYFDQWILLFSLKENNNRSRNFKNFIRLLPPKDRFWADPFILKKDKYFIFIEELLYKENKGKISVIEMDSNGNYTNPEVVLETGYHLSYPFLIEDDNELYMLPETQQNRTIELYKCIEFPKKWKLEKILFSNIKAVDTTIYKHNNKYWLFTNLTEHNGEDVINELFLFYSDSLLSDTWISHPQNPITTDHTFSRAAGSIFKHENKLYRPSQNCSKHYGYGIQLQEIIKLTETEYQEKNIESIYPDWENDLLSTHTINTLGNLTIIDAKISRKK